MLPNPLLPVTKYGRVHTVVHQCYSTAKTVSGNPPPTRFIRKAKSGTSWTQKDLVAYNISLVSRSAAAFFGQDPQALSVPNNHPLLRDTTSGITDKDVIRVLRTMKTATMTPGPNGDSSAVVSFTMDLLYALGYAETNSGRIVQSHRKIPLYICGKWRHAKTDLNVFDMDQDSIILVVQNVEHYTSNLKSDKSIPWLVAEAIAAFQRNNRVRKESGLSPLDSKVMPGITMTGTFPTFFKVCVSTELVLAIESGQYPATPTIVEMHVPVIPRPQPFQ